MTSPIRLPRLGSNGAVLKYFDTLPYAGVISHQYILDKNLTLLFDNILMPEQHIRVLGDWLVILLDAGENKTLQFISKNGEKKFLPGRPAKKAYLILNSKRDDCSSGICEGFATGGTISSLLNARVYVSFSSSNLPVILENCIPLDEEQDPFCIFADHDIPGLGAANKASKFAKGCGFKLKLVFPAARGDDFNDEYCRNGSIDPVGRLEYDILALLLKYPENYYSDYSEWLKIGFSLHRFFKGSKNGFALFNAFSAKWISYDEESVLNKWDSFETTEPGLSLDYLIGIAEKFKIKVSTILVKNSDQFIGKYIDDCKTPENNTDTDIELQYDLLSRKEIVNNLENWVYIYSMKSYFNLKTRACIERDCAKDYFFNLCNKKGNIHNSLLKNKKVRKVMDFSYFPGKPSFLTDEFNKSILNSWIKPTMVPAEGNVESFIGHIKYLGGSNWKNVFKFLAWCVQNPGKKIGYMLLIIGQQGIGKTYVEFIMRNLLGVHNLCCISTDSILERFSGWAISNQLIVINELMSIGEDRMRFYNNIKTFITDDYAPIRKMRADVEMVQNFVNFIAFSNYDNPVQVDGDDRRLLIVKCYKKIKTPKYYQDLFSWTENNFPEILNFLLGFDTSDVRIGKAPATQQKTIYSNETNDLQELIHLENEVVKNNIYCFTGTEAKNYLNKGFESPAKFGSLLSRHFQNICRISVSGVRETIYCIKTEAEKYMGISPDELRYKLKNNKLSDLETNAS